MKSRHLRRIGLALVAAASLTLGACSGGTDSGSTQGSDGETFLTIPREDMGTFTRNFNPFAPSYLPMTGESIYERMFVYSSTSGETTPWLATEWSMNDDSTQATFSLRDGVKWSDGEPLVAADVVTSFNLQKEYRGGFDYLDKVTAVDDQTVQFDFNRSYSPGLFEIGGQLIVPDHIWGDMENPDKNTNEDPVGTGPYTEVAQFSSQSYDLTKNQNYWQPEKQKIDGIRMLAFPSNDGANLALQNGDADWGDQFIPDVEKTFVDLDPDHNHYWFAQKGGMIHWQLNTTKAPYNDADFRKALSMAIDRDQVSEIGMNGYSLPADCTGLSNSYADWKDADLVKSCEWTTYDPDAAAAALDELGFKVGSDGFRTNPDGSALSMKLMVGSASSDWLSVMNVVAQNLQDININAEVDAPDWAVVNDAYQQGTFDTGIVWSANDPTPYQYYRDILDTRTVVPVGEQTFQNFHRYGSEDGTKLLDEFAATSDEATQKDVVNKLQALFNEEAPLIPLFTGPEWGAYSDTRFTGFPSEDNPYATLSTRSATTVLVLTSLEPVG